MNRWIRALALSAALLLPASAAAQDAGKSAPPPVADLVLKLSAKDPKARLDACTALKTRWPDAARAVPALIEVADDDESADVKKAAVDTLGVFGDEGGKSFAAWVKGLEVEERTAISHFVASSGPDLIVVEHEVTTSWPLVVASLSGPSPHGETVTASAVPALASRDERVVTAARASLGAFAQNAALRNGVLPRAGNDWAGVGESLLGGGWVEGRRLGIAVFASLAPAGEPARDRLLTLATDPSADCPEDVWTALARGGPVPESIADRLVAAAPGLQPLEHARRLGLAKAIARAWSRRVGGFSVRDRWIAERIVSKDPATVALFRRAEEDLSQPSRLTWAYDVWCLAEYAGTAPVSSLLGFGEKSLPPDQPIPPNFHREAISVRAAAVLATLDVAPRHAGATRALQQMLESPSRVLRETAVRVIESLGPGAVDVPPELLLEPSSGELRSIAFAERVGQLAVRAVPGLVLTAETGGRGGRPGGIAYYADHAAVRNSLWALGKIGPSASSALPTVRRFLDSPDAQVAHIARTAIRRIEAK